MTSTIVYDQQWREMEREILKLVEKNQHGQGASLDEMHLEVKNRYTREMLKIVLQNLKSAGKILNSLDDNHWMTFSLQDEVYNSIKIMERKSKFGADIHLIHKEFFKEKYSYWMLNEIVLSLNEQGRVYSTIDECHFMTCSDDDWSEIGLEEVYI